MRGDGDVQMRKLHVDISRNHDPEHRGAKNALLTADTPHPAARGAPSLPENYFPMDVPRVGGSPWCKPVVSTQANVQRWCRGFGLQQTVHRTGQPCNLGKVYAVVQHACCLTCCGTIFRFRTAPLKYT